MGGGGKTCCCLRLLLTSEIGSESIETPGSQRDVPTALAFLNVMHMMDVWPPRHQSRSNSTYQLFTAESSICLEWEFPFTVLFTLGSDHPVEMTFSWPSITHCLSVIYKEM